MSGSSTTPNPDNLIILGQPLLRVPQELLRKNFRTSQRYVEKDTNYLTGAVNDAVKSASQGATPDKTLEQLDAMIARIEVLKKKMSVLREEEATRHSEVRARAEHMDELYGIQSLEDDKFNNWSSVQLNRLMVDYLVRQDLRESAKELATATGIERLVDVDVFVQCSKIVNSLKNRKITECLNWCMENQKALKKQGSTLEFDLRLQQFIEYVRGGDIKAAIAYMKKHMGSSTSPEIQKAAALLVYPPTTVFEPYKTLFSPKRWDYLASSFMTTHHNLLCLPSKPPFQIALLAGLSALKTPRCHEDDRKRLLASGASMCPICSTELNDLARGVPYAHHDRSYVEPDPVVLPNGRIYGRKRLQFIAPKGGAKEGRVRDPITGEEYPESSVAKVFIA